MPNQDHNTAGQIKIVASPGIEQDLLAERQKAANLLSQITVTLDKLENQWDGMTMGQRAELLRQIEIQELKAWRFMIRKIAPRLLI